MGSDTAKASTFHADARVDEILKAVVEYTEASIDTETCEAYERILSTMPGSLVDDAVALTARNTTESCLRANEKYSKLIKLVEALANRTGN